MSLGKHPQIIDLSSYTVHTASTQPAHASYRPVSITLTRGSIALTVRRPDQDRVQRLQLVLRERELVTVPGILFHTSQYTGTPPLSRSPGVSS